MSVPKQLTSMLNYLEIDSKGKRNETANKELNDGIIKGVMENYTNQMINDIIADNIKDLKEGMDSMETVEDMSALNLPLIPIMLLSPEIFEFFKFIEYILIKDRWNISTVEGLDGSITIQFKPLVPKEPIKDETREEPKVRNVGKKPRRKPKQ